MGAGGWAERKSTPSYHAHDAKAAELRLSGVALAASSIRAEVVLGKLPAYLIWALSV